MLHYYRRLKAKTSQKEQWRDIPYNFEAISSNTSLGWIDIESIKENATKYAFRRSLVNMDDKSPSSYYMVGYMDDLEDIVGVEPEDYDKHDPEGDVPPEEEIPEDEENSQEPKEPERNDDASN